MRSGSIPIILNPEHQFIELSHSFTENKLFQSSIIHIVTLGTKHKFTYTQLGYRTNQTDIIHT